MPSPKNEYSFVVRYTPLASVPRCGKSPMHADGFVSSGGGAGSRSAIVVGRSLSAVVLDRQLVELQSPVGSSVALTAMSRRFLPVN